MSGSLEMMEMMERMKREGLSPVIVTYNTQTNGFDIFGAANWRL